MGAGRSSCGLVHVTQRGTNSGVACLDHHPRPGEWLCQCLCTKQARWTVPAGPLLTQISFCVPTAHLHSSTPDKVSAADDDAEAGGNRASKRPRNAESGSHRNDTHDDDDDDDDDEEEELEEA